MKKFYLPLILLIVVLITGCASEEGEQTITIENRYKLTMPSFLSKTEDLNEDASLQYQNLFKEFYLLVIDEPKSDLQGILDDYDLNDSYTNDLDGYSNLIIDGVLNNLIDPTKSDMVETHINGLPARVTTITGTIEGIDILYTYGIYEGKELYYQVISWTEIEKQSKYQPKMDAIVQSFKELDSHSKKAKGL